MSAEGGTLTRQNTSMMQKEATMRSTEATLSGGGNTTTSFGDSYNKTLLQSPSAKTYLRDTTGAESILVSGGAPRYQPWVGDYTLDRFRHLLENGNRFALSGPQLEYEDTFDWDRGGKKSVPYHCKTSYIPGTKTSMAGYPTLLTENAHVGTPPYKAALRLPAISSPVKTITKSVSCVDLSGTFYGKFTTRPTLVATSGGDYGSASGSGSPSARNMRKVMSARSVVPGGEAAIQKISGLTVREVDATQRLWRESMTGDMYFAPPGKKDKDKKRFDPSVDEIPGMGSAFRDGGSINWCNPEADGMSLFALKCAMNEKKMLDYLWLQHGPDIFTHDYKNRNLFHQCARQAACESLTFLLRKLDAKVALVLATERDEDGNTPLHLAADQGSVVIAELLLKACGHKELLPLRNARGEAPKATAERCLAHHMVQLLSPSTYVNDPNSLINRMRARLNKNKGTGEEEGDGEEEEEEEEAPEEGGDDDEDGEEGGKSVGGKFKNLISMDRICNRDRAAAVKAAKKKGKKGGKKKKKK